MTNTPYFFDILFVGIMVFMYGYGKRRGAFRVIAGLCGTLAALIIAMTLCPAVEPVVASIITPYAERAVESAAEAMELGEAIKATVQLGEKAGQTMNALGSLTEKFAFLGLSEKFSQLSDDLGISETLDKLITVTTGEFTPLELLSRAIVAKIAPTLTFFLIFAAVKLAIWFAVKVLSLDWPIIGALNRLAGGAIGLLGGAVIILAVCAGISIYGSTEPTGITSEVMLSQSIIGGAVCGFFFAK